MLYMRVIRYLRNASVLLPDGSFLIIVLNLRVAIIFFFLLFKQLLLYYNIIKLLLFAVLKRFSVKLSRLKARGSLSQKKNLIIIHPKTI